MPTPTMSVTPQRRRHALGTPPCASPWTGSGAFPGAAILWTALRTFGWRALTILPSGPSGCPATWSSRGTGRSSISTPSTPGTDMPSCVPRRSTGRTARWAATFGSLTYMRDCWESRSVSASRGWSRPSISGSTDSSSVTLRTALPPPTSI